MNKSHLDNDPSSYEFYEMTSADSEDFYWMISECLGLGFVPLMSVIV